MEELTSKLGGVKAHDSRRDDQRRRREDRLRAQREGRRDLIAFARGLAGVPMEQVRAADEGSDAEPADGPAGSVRVAEVMDVEPARTARDESRLKTACAGVLVEYEWMSELPDDLGRNWLLIPRPAGTRCLVVSSGGETTARRRNGSVLARFPSALPGGRRATRGAHERARGRAGLCALDCIWCPAAHTYIVLDVLCWCGYVLLDCAAEFRLFWAHTKLAETDAAEQSRTNPCAFVPAPFHEATAAAFDALHSGAWPYPEGAARDGLLLLHREGAYEGGPSPLNLSWADASCSARFFDYGSAEMRAQIERDPRKASSWQADMRDSALSADQIREALNLSAAALGGAAAAAAAQPPPLVSPPQPPSGSRMAVS